MVEDEGEKEQNGPGIANAFGFPVPLVGDDITLRWETGPTKKHPDGNTLKARHPSGVWIFPDRASSIMPLPGERTKCRISKVCVKPGTSCCYGFGMILDVLADATITRPRLAPIVAEALLLGIDQKRNELDGAKLKNEEERNALKADVDRMHAILNDKEESLKQKENALDEINAKLEALEQARLDFGNQTVSDEVTTDSSLETGPAL